MLTVFGSHRLMDGCGERSTFVVVGYLHFLETTKNADFVKNAKGHVHAFLIPLL